MTQIRSLPQPGPARVLLLTDQQLVSEMIKLTLNHGSFLARDTADVNQAVLLLQQWQPHLAIVDMDVANGQFLHHCTRAADTRRLQPPVLALTRRGDLPTKLDAFDQGVDDIMTIPFSPEELLARTLVIARRAYGAALPFAPVLRVGDLEIDIVNRSVQVDDHELHLSGLELSLLYLLAANAGRIITRNEILDALWGSDFVADSNIVDRHIRNLRIRLQNNWRHPRFIATIPGKGYRFIPHVTEEPAS